VSLKTPLILPPWKSRVTGRLMDRVSFPSLVNSHVSAGGKQGASFFTVQTPTILSLLAPLLIFTLSPAPPATATASATTRQPTTTRRRCGRRGACFIEFSS